MYMYIKDFAHVYLNGLARHVVLGAEQVRRVVAEFCGFEVRVVDASVGEVVAVGDGELALLRSNLLLLPEWRRPGRLVTQRCCKK